MRKNEAIKTGDTRRVGEQVPIELAKTKLQRQQQRYSIDMAMNIYTRHKGRAAVRKREREMERGREGERTLQTLARIERQSRAAAQERWLARQ